MQAWKAQNLLQALMFYDSPRKKLEIPLKNIKLGVSLSLTLMQMGHIFYFSFFLETQFISIINPRSYDVIS